MHIVQYMLYHLKTFRGKTIVHVGAHHGQELDRYSSLFARKVIWVEANPKTFGTLQANIEEFRSRPPGTLKRLLGIAQTEHVGINALVTEKDGAEYEFYQFNNGGLSDSVFHLAEGTQFPDLKETGSVLRLNSNKLDTILRQAGQEPSEVDVLVLDTEGAELICMKGAEATLTNVQYIQTEISTKPVYTGGVLYGELNSWLYERGFRRCTAIRRSQMNVIFKSKELKRAA
jgi:FkbM family methyltransferase